MKRYWYAATILLFIGVISGFTSIKPTTALIANMAPKWDFPTTDFNVGEEPIIINLDYAFFDLDGDEMNYSIESEMPAELNDSILTIKPTKKGIINITATDGRYETTQKITIN